MVPRENKSARLSTGLPLNCSGAMYEGVPMTSPVWVSCEVCSMAMPKSVILARRGGVGGARAPLRDEPERLLARHPPLPPQHFQGGAFDVLHHNEGSLALRVFPGVEDGDDAGVGEAAGRP